MIQLKKIWKRSFSKEGSFVIDGKEVKVFSDADPKNLPWKELDIDVVLECAGFLLQKKKLCSYWCRHKE